MAEILKTPERGEIIINEAILSEVVDKMLAEKDQGEILTKAFFWRAIYLYCEEMKYKLDETQMSNFYHEIGPVLVRIFKAKHRSCVGLTYAKEESPATEPASRYLEAERRLEDLNDRGPRLGA